MAYPLRVFPPSRCNPWVPNGAVAPLGLAAKERWEHLTRLVELYK
ncbi:hypothetical protein [Flavonifractor sp. An9]|nr:hypothetical protein [Flavonifractor sp. An9]